MQQTPFDLHAFSLKDIANVVKEYTGRCARGGNYEARIIHGRGKRGQRENVRYSKTMICVATWGR